MADSDKSKSKSKSDSAGEDTGPGVASASENESLEHTAGGKTTRDSMDAGVPMTPGAPDEPVGPEDAFGPGPKRGDYSERIRSGPSLETRLIPQDDGADPEEERPTAELVEQAPRAAEQGDSPGKGGVSTQEAVDERAALQPSTDSASAR